jgi:hypothetical protein
MRLKSILFLLLLSSQIFSQWETPRRFSNAGPSEAVLLQCSNDSLIFIWRESFTINYSLGTSDGLNWGEIFTLDQFANRDLTAFVTNSGKIIVAFKKDRINWNDYYVMYYSDDNGSTWSDGQSLITDSDYPNYTGSFFEINSELWFVYRNGNSACTIKSTDNGLTWSSKEVLFTDANYLTKIHLFQFNNKLISIFKRDGLRIKESTDNGASWEVNARLINGTWSSTRDFSAVKTYDNKIIIYFTESQYSNYFSSSNIYTVSSSDEGSTWSAKKKFTNFVGYDSQPELRASGETVYAAFSSNRGELYDQSVPWYGKVNITIDSSAPPHIFHVEDITDDNSVIIKAYVKDDNILDSVKAIYQINDTSLFHIQMYDDGLHDDELPNDDIFGIKVANLNQLDKLTYHVVAIDDQLNADRSPNKTIIISSDPIMRYGEINVNNLLLPIDNKGVLADVLIGNSAGGYYDENVFLFSGGFYLSGYSNGALWGNGVLTASRIEDYQSGVEGSNPENYNNIVYSVRTSDPPFGMAWQKWIDAVAMGADFYDGNNDSIYDPVDLNGNGFWDFNEDRPDLQGDITTWCVYNDGVPQPIRRYAIDPQGIEIRQTVFASDGNGSQFDDIIFIRYRIENTGTTASEIDSVYFAAAADPDIGDFTEDLLGYDILEQSGYTYKPGPDARYGINPPSFFIKQLQGPPVFIAGETFIDNNSNGQFDDGIDTPLDSAVARRGKYLGTEYLPGAKNFEPNAFTQYMGSHPTHGDPDTHFELRNYMLGGKGKYGDNIYVSTWEFGNGASLGIDTNNIDTRFMYSGDPVEGTGWLNIETLDQRCLLSTGPFKLKAGEPLELIYAYIVGSRQRNRSS